jgi:hypothetical protein
MLIDAVISGDRIVNKKEADKILKHEHLTTQIVHMECRNRKRYQ